MGWSMDFPWWVYVLVYIYLVGVRFGIGATLGFVTCHVWLSAPESSGRKDKSKVVRNFVSTLCALFGGLVNYGVVTAFS